MTHVRLLKKLAVVAAAGLLALGLGAATASSAFAAAFPDIPDVGISHTTPSGEISTDPQR